MIYIDSHSTDANFNFALEKYCMYELDIADSYFLFWRTEPTLMIGKFQNALQEINMDYVKAHAVNVVRRITGGGTIYTDMNGWQFSFITRHPEGKNIDFANHTEPIIHALAAMGVDAELSGRNDLLIDGRKFSGNAQFKARDVNLHHGSILFDTNIENMVKALTVSDDKLIAKGIKSVRSRVTNVAEHLKSAMTSLEFRDRMLAYLTKNMATYQLTEGDLARIHEIKFQQFDTWEWNFGTAPKFNVTKEQRYAGGKLSVCSWVEKGIIHDIEFYGDFFEQRDLNGLKKSLIGCRYERTAVEEALMAAEAGSYMYRISADDILDLIVE